MGYLGLDWGNVPSWFSAASFGAAAYVIARDRGSKNRNQVNQVGVWLEITPEKMRLSDDSLSETFRITIHVKNSGDLPVRYLGAQVAMQISRSNKLKPEEMPGGAGTRRRRRTLHTTEDIYVHDRSTVPPGREVVIVSDVEIEFKTNRELNLLEVHALIDRYDLLDNSMRNWRISTYESRENGRTATVKRTRNIYGRYYWLLRFPRSLWSVFYRRFDDESK
ncbi:hypothetical protein OG439_16570 [Amycolatopsis sp. NBC_01307]|uniref:hypothetical protein n=1 Tax=Amycolatopsis sp. NBC_01307 TaxID=2903561 RepID=UPI002E142855|nr:hypothetical protein OG439_16570 [Amycolatopsis sp. NBC_01307]